MFALYTDYGVGGPYVGQLHARLSGAAPGVPIIDLFHDLPPFDIRAAAYLLPAYTDRLPRDAVCLCVVDPGVGSARDAVMVRTRDRWYVGPDNGLFVVLARRDPKAVSYRLTWRPSSLSASFHGRDLFAPCAVRLLHGERPDSEPAPLTVPPGEWPDDLSKVLYIDRFGNAITGLRASMLARDALLTINGHRLQRARVFADVATGEAFWYENANGLVELAVNRGRADERLAIAHGMNVCVLTGAEQHGHVVGGGRHA